MTRKRHKWTKNYPKDLQNNKNATPNDQKGMHSNQ